MKKESKKRIAVIVICILLLLVLLIVVLGKFKNVEAQRKEDNLISSEAAPGIDIDDVHTNPGVQEKESYSIASVSDAGEAEGKTDLQNEMQGEKTMSEISIPESKAAEITIETEHVDRIAAPDMNSFSGSESHSTDNSGSADGTAETIENQQESISESETPGVPGFPGEPGDNRTAFEKAKEASELQGKSSYYEYYLNYMSPQEKQELYDSAPSPAAFLNWVSDLRKEYDIDHKHDLPEGISIGN